MAYSGIGEKRQRLLVIAAVSALLLGMMMLFSAAPSAKANERHFCWGATVPPKNQNGQCDTAGFWGEYWYGYIDAVYGSGDQHSVCVGIGPKGQPGSTMCSSGPNQGVYNNSMNGAIGFPFVANNSTGSSTKVYGVAYYHTSPGEESPPPPPPLSWHYANVGGGTILGDPSLSSSGANKLDLFVQGLDGNLWQKWSVDGGTSWSAFSNISAIAGGAISSSPGSVSWGAGRVDIVARMSNGSLGHWYHNGAWHFENLGGPTSSKIAGDPEVVSTGAGSLNVFVRGEDGNLWQRWTTNSGVTWSGWQNVSAMLGGPIASGPGAVSALPNSLTVVARKPDSTVGIWSYGSSGWSFQTISGQILGDPDIASTGEGRVNIFVEGLDGNLWQQWTSGVGWSGWQQLSSSPLGSGPSGVSWGAPRVDVAARMSDGTIGHWWYGS